MTQTYDALFLVSFGGPEKQEDVMPFLENVLRGKNVPEERKKEVAHHYEIFGGVSPINQQNRELKLALEGELQKRQMDLPVYWGNRNWDPYIKDALEDMKRDGIQNALAYVTSAFSSYSGCRQYREEIEWAQKKVAGAPSVEKLRVFFNHPKFIDVHRERIEQALQTLGGKEGVHLVFTAHSIPLSMSETSDYVKQLKEACRLVAERTSVKDHVLVYQSRSGPPHVPWLEPDILDYLQDAKTKGVKKVCLSPIGFVSDHMEVLYDLDLEAKEEAKTLGLQMARAKTPGSHPLFVEMIIDLVEERLGQRKPEALGDLGPWHNVCPPDCCKPPLRRPLKPKL